MKRIMIPAIVFVALIGVGFVLRSRPASIELSATTAAMPSLLELHTMAGVSKLSDAGNGGPVAGVSDS